MTVSRACSVLVSALGIASLALLGFLGIGPRIGRYRTLTVLSGSMRPGISPGAVVVAVPEQAAAVRVGQVVTYAIPLDDHHVVTHRVVEVVGGADQRVFRTKGDANNTPDPWQVETRSTAVWRVRAVVPGLGYAVHWLRTGILRVVGVMIIPAALASWWVAGIWREEDGPAVAVVGS